jgi:hypothetical protein
MRKTITILVLLSIILSGCSVIPAMKPTLSPDEMSTKVAVLLTAMPTEPGQQPAIPAADMGMAQVTVSPLPAEIGVLATPTSEGGSGLITPTMDETAFAAFLGATSIPGTATQVYTPTEPAISTSTLLVNTTAKSTATPPIAMPSATPTSTSTATFTPGPQPLTDAQLTATFAPSDPRTILPVPTWTDTMDNGKNWPLGPDKYTLVDFQNGYMMLTGLQKDNGWRLASTNADNAYIEATAKFGATCHGMDKWGIMVRSPNRATADQGYWFNITCDGKFAFQKWNANPKDDEKSVTNLIAWTSNSNIKPGGNALNRVGILANADHFTFYINGAQIGEWTDNSYMHGGFGLLIGARETDRLTLYVDEVSMWLNPPM